MIVWEQVDPERFERAVQMLLNKLHPGVRSLDGSGGDGGKDATWASADEVVVFEMKSFTGRLTSARKRQVEKSLRRALENAPGMTRWELIVPINMTPVRTGAKSSEQAWFEGQLAAIAGGVELVWRDRGWLDRHFASNADLREYVEGPMSEVLRLAKEARMEQDVLAGGVEDLAARNARLRERVDALSPNWTMDWEVRGDTHQSTLRAKHPRAAEVDPIRMTPTFSFARQDPAARAKAAELDHVLAFGGTVDVPGDYVTDFAIDTSPETMRLLGTASGSLHEVSFVLPPEPLERPIKTVLNIIETSDGSVVARVPIYFRSRTGGHRGVTLHGNDAAEILTVTLVLPRPEQVKAAQRLLGDRAVRFSVAEDLVGYDAESLVPVLDVMRHVGPGHRMRFDLPGLGSATSAELAEPGFGETGRAWQVASDLHRLAEHNACTYQFPRHITAEQERTMRWAVQMLDGRVQHDETVTAVDIDGGRLREFLDHVPEEIPGGMFMSSPDLELQVGDLTIPYGPVARWWEPPLRIRNHSHLADLAGSGQDLGGQPVAVEFESGGQPSTWLSYPEAVERGGSGAGTSAER